LKVGDSGTGTGALSVEAGGAVSSVNGYLGWGPASSGKATVTGPGSQWSNSEKLHVGYFGTGTLNVEAGGEVSNVNWGYVGFKPGSTGEVLVTGSGSHWNNLNLSGLIVGYQGDGTLNVLAGGLVSNHYGFIGHASGSTGEVTVTGPGSRWNNSNYLHVGSSSSGTLNVEAGAVVSNTLGYIGHNSGSTGEVTVTGINSQWNNSNTVYIGYRGDGTLNVETGAVVSSGWGYISRHAGSTGTATVRGAGSQWNNSTDLDVGHSGNGTLQVEAGGVVSSLNAFIGRFVGSTSQATVTGPGSEWNNSNLNVGGNAAGAGGSGTLNLHDSGLVSVSDTTRLWSTATINLDGGNLTTGSFDNSEGGALNFHDGTLTVNGAGGSFDPGAGDFTIDGQIAADLPALVITGTVTATLPDKLIVGSSNRATLTVDAGGVVANSETGYGGSSTGVATVSGPGSQWNNSSNLIVGYSGDGTLNVTDGGAVSNNSYSAIGYHFGSISVATVSGSDSHWSNLGSLYVGRSGDGRLNVEAGGEVNNTHGFLGRYINSTGEATVTGPGSQWNNSSLTVGGDTSVVGGSGTLNLTDSGLANISGTTRLWSTATINLDGGNLTTGSFDNSEGGILNFHDGTLTVNGAGGSFDPGAGDFTINGLAADDLPELVITGTASSTLPNKLTVGSNRPGKLTVAAGGTVSNAGWGSIGQSSGSTSEVTVTGTDSRWNNGSVLVVGGWGDSVLNVEAGGIVSNTIGFIGRSWMSTSMATVTGTDSRWNNSDRLYVGYSGDGTLHVTDEGVVSSNSGWIAYESGSTGSATVTGPGSRWNNSSVMGVGNSGNGSLNVESGGVVTNASAYIGRWADSSGVATVSGSGSQWNNSHDLQVGVDGNAVLNIANDGLVTVGGTTSIGSAGMVNLTGGRFEFGQTTFAEFSTINAASGAMAGNVVITGVHDVASLTALQNPAVDLSEVAAANEGLLHGTAILKTSLTNRSTGELRTTSSDWVRFEGLDNTNAGEINNFGGQVDFLQNVTNQSGGFIGGRGEFVADGGWTNAGVMFFSGTTDLLGDVVNDSGGQIVTSGFATTTFYDDLVHNGTEIRTSAGSSTVIAGSATGTGAYTGTVFFEGDLRPGSSPGQVSFGGHVVLGTTARLESELLGTTAGTEHDQLPIAGTVELDGTLDLLPLAPYTDPGARGTADNFVIITAGARSGNFSAIRYDGSPLVADSATDGSGSFRSHQGSGLFRSVTYTATTVQLQNLLALAGDTDLSDYNRLATNFDPVGAAGPYTWPTGNFDGDDDIDLSDYNSLAANFNPGGYGAAAVPEPAAVCLLVAGLLLLCRTRFHGPSRQR
jgi:T5SS/PEP-CTERM-associated repeat protein